VPFYEVTFETGRISVACYKDDAEAQLALGEHHRRAVEGEAGGPLGQPAERIKVVRVYKKHPNEFNPEGTMSADVLQKDLQMLMDGMKDENGIVDIGQFSVEVRGLTHPMKATRDGSFDSQFRMEEDRELKLAFVGAK